MPIFMCSSSGKLSVGALKKTAVSLQSWRLSTIEKDPA